MGRICPCMLMILGALFFYSSLHSQSGIPESISGNRASDYYKDSSFSFSHFFDSIFLTPKISFPFIYKNEDKRKPINTTLIQTLNKNKILSFNKPVEILYTSDYRAINDTPFNESNILQQSIIAGTKFKMGGILPFNMYMRASLTNSSYFKDYFDVQLNYDASHVHQAIKEDYDRIVDELYAEAIDSITYSVLNQKSEIINQLSKWLNNPVQTQKLVEYRELLIIDGISYKSELSYEENRRKEDSLKIIASEFLDAYDKAMSFYNQTFQEVDSLKNIITESLNKIDQIKKILNKPTIDYKDLKEKRTQLSKLGVSNKIMNRLSVKLQGLRKLGIGRNLVDYSDLSMKNISVNGINFEYNSWYYASLTAGTLDFGYRNLSFFNNLSKQYVYMARFGVGNIERNAFIISYFGGKKQLFRESKLITREPAINTNGFSLEGKLVLLNSLQARGEVSETISSAFIPQKFFSFSDFNNKAVSFSIKSLPSLINTRFEASFKILGNNYQSFTGYNQNSSRKQFFVRLDQSFFNRSLKISGKIRSFEFDNPLIIQKYNSKNFLKDISITYRKKGMPVITTGYIPISQIYFVDDVLTEENFQSFNFNLYHNYTLFKIRTSSYLSLNSFDKFDSDKSIDFFRTNNFSYYQSLFFKHADIGFSVNYAENNYYTLFVFEENVSFKLSSGNRLMAGLKINNYNFSILKLGYYINTNLALNKNFTFHAGFEKGFVPGFNNTLMLNHYGTMAISIRL